MIQAIETVYNGYRMRSRLEARWAVFFDAMGTKYEYEKEGFDLDGIWYLPDFWLPELSLWVEIKPTAATDGEKKKAYLLAEKLNANACIVQGNPWVSTIELDLGKEIYPILEKDYKAHVFFGNIASAPWWHEFFGRYMFESLSEFLGECRQEHPGYHLPEVPRFDGSQGSAVKLMEIDRLYFSCKYGKSHPHWRYGISDENYAWSEDQGKLTLRWHHVEYDHAIYTPKLRDAYIAARQARFEHGETPEIRF